MTDPKVNQQEKVRLVETCLKCRKPITSKSRAGSFTSFLFSENRCKCAGGPKLATHADGSHEVAQSATPFNQLIEKPDLGERYEVIDLVGCGGMGAVWKVRDKSIDTLLAVKVLRPELALDRLAVKRFEQEAQAAAVLTHANLASVYGTGTTNGGSPFILMDFLEGASLADVIRTDGPLDCRRALDVTIQVCEALQHAHNKGIVHRDVKPSNIMLKVNDGGSDAVKLVDFGIAKVMPTVDSQSNRFTQTGELFGSPLYMSPEQCLGEKLDSRSDVYSLGCVLYESLTGQSPFEAENPVRTVLKHLTDEPPTLSIKGSQASEIQTIVSASLQRSPDLRYQDATSMLSDLRSVSEGGTAANARRILAEPSQHSNEHYYRFLGVKRPTLIILVAAVAAFCSFLGVGNLIALVVASLLTSAALIMWFSYVNRLSARAKLMESSLLLPQVSMMPGPLFSRLSRYSCLAVGLVLLPAVFIAFQQSSLNIMVLGMYLGILAIVLVGLVVLIDLGVPRQRTQINARKFTVLSIISPFSYLFLSMWLSMCALYTAGYFALLISLLKDLLHADRGAFAATVVAGFAGLTGIMMIITFAVLVGLIVTANLKVLMTIVKSFLPDRQIPRKVNLLSLAICAGFVVTPIACLIIPLNFATGVCLSSLSLLNAIFFLSHLLKVVDSQVQKQPRILESKRN